MNQRTGQKKKKKLTWLGEIELYINACTIFDSTPLRPKARRKQ